MAVQKIQGDQLDFVSVTKALTEVAPVFAYTLGVLDSITYASGNTKTFTYTLGVLSRIDYVIGSLTRRQDFTYNGDGTLNYITYSEF